MYFNGMFCMDSWNEDAQYAIFDDWEDWSKFYLYKQFLGAQGEFVVTDKYRKKINVMWGKPSIVISNKEPEFKDWEWIKANCFLVFVENKLY